MAEKVSAAPTEQNASGSENSAFAAPKISLPKGGGAIRGIGEKFAANPVTGTGSMTIPIATSPGRSGFAPQLALSYDSGVGNGPFGLGWHLSLPSITRKTDKGLPRYDDAAESDVFILSGAEDLVPVLVQDNTNNWVRQNDLSRRVFGKNYLIQSYRPRVEGLFARIERWTNESDRADTFWRSISKDNITTWYGRTEKSRIADPADPARVFAWLICQSYDDKGNILIYDYKQEDSSRLDLAQANERNRTPQSRSANQYLKRIRYGNCTPYLPKFDPEQPPTALPSGTDWLFEVVFDYGEHDKASPSPSDDAADPAAKSTLWPVRNDPFSSYRAGFEVRTYRLCERVLMFHHFPGEPEVSADCLVRSTDFTYSHDTNPNDARNPIYSFLISVTQTGYKREPLGGYLSRSVPPVEFTYSEATIQEEIREVDPASLENLPTGLDGSAYQWVDLDGEGLSGMLSEQTGGWFYKRNLSPINVVGQNGSAHIEACFAPVELIAAKPAFGLAAGQAQFMDLAGDGQPDMVTFGGPTPGFYERTPDAGGWEPFTPMASLPVLDWNDPNLKFVDITGDGHADILITEDDVFRWHPSLAEEGFGPQEVSRQSRDEETGPQLVFAEGTQSIYLADQCGDGLSDLVRIRNGEVCYWPNLGYGRFGAKVTMDNAPWFDSPDQFDQKRIRLADIDGSGTTDIIYLHGDGVRIYFNQSGNSWSPSPTVPVFPPIDSHTAVTVVDLLGNGTACLVWSSSLPGDARRPMRYIDLMGGQKPHLLIKTVNNLGAETVVSYAPSTRFYLADRLTGNPWITRLPFPVHCVERVTVTDKWRQTSFSSTYSYHHGYFDGAEREFRGFGRVEQVDTEGYGAFADRSKTSFHITEDKTLYQPPVKTITWFHTGAALDCERILTQFQGEYFPNSLAALPSPVTIDKTFEEKPLPEPDLNSLNLSAEEWLEALRACKGLTLRQEVYELDVDALEPGDEKPPKQIPVRLFSAATHNRGIRCVQPRGNNQHAVFLVTESEALSYQYELALPKDTSMLQPDPRIAHTLNLRHDEYGNSQQSVAIGYGRWQPGNYAGLPRPELVAQVQGELHVAYTESRYTLDVILSAQATGDSPVRHHRLRLPFEVLSYELKGIPGKGLHYYELEDFRACDLSTFYGHAIGETTPATPVQVKQYHETADGSAPQMRIVEQVRTAFFDDASDTAPPDNTNPLPFGQHGPRGFKYEDYKLALSAALLNAVFAQVDLSGQINDKLSWEVQSAQGAAAAKTARDLLDDAGISGYWTGPQSGALPGEYWMRSGRAGFANDAHLHFYLPEQYSDAFGNTTTVSFDQSYHLFLKSSTDALGNTTSVEEFDFRVLSPRRLKDRNHNLSEVAFDCLGMPATMALLGSGSEGDSLAGLTDALLNPSSADVQGFFAGSYSETFPRQWLGDSTARYVYWFGEEINPDGSMSWARHPAAACAVLRETHVAVVNAAASGPSPLQVAIEHSDGLGSVLVKKRQAEPASGDSTLRWIANGKTVLNNKGKPVKQYEPYFSDTEHRFDETEAQREVGVTPLMYYDAPGRLIRTELPDGTLSRVEFSPWHATSFDANDTILESLWYQDRGAPNPALPLTAGASPDTRAAWLAARHANTPALTLLDSLGRNVIAIAHNRVEDAAGSYSFDGRKWKDDFYLTFTKLDAEGKPLWIRDARGNLVTQYITPPKPTRLADDANEDIPSRIDPNTGKAIFSAPCYDIAGNLLHQHSMDAGDRWMLMDATGKPMLAWDFNEWQEGTDYFDERRLYRTEYDALHRPTGMWLLVWSRPNKSNIDFKLASTEMVERFDYQDAQAVDPANLNGQLIRHFDPSGCIETIRCDFKGNVEEVHRNLVSDPTASRIDWLTNANGDGTSKLDTGTYIQIAEHDAMGRMTTLFNWHRTGLPVAVYQPQYSERGLLKKESLRLHATKTPTSFDPNSGQLTQAIQDLRYNAKGQKEFLKLGNGTITHYDYDKNTFRLQQLRTTRLTIDQVDPDFPDFRSNLSDPRVSQQLNYSYDPVGNITGIYDEAYEPVFFQNQQVEARSRYEYDALYRLIGATGRENGALTGAPTNLEDSPVSAQFPIQRSDPNALRIYTQTYGYDSAGNMERLHHEAGPVGTWTRRFHCADDSNRMLATWDTNDDWSVVNPAIVTQYDFDTHGNMRNLMRSDPRFNLCWDQRDMIRGIDLGGGGQAYYQYDAGKQRTRKRIDRNDSGIEERIYLGGYELYRRTVAGAVVEEIESHHLFEGEQRVLLVDDVTITANNTPYPRPDGLTVKAQTLFRYQYSNHLGSACLELDQEAGIISYEEYHPYGTSAYRAKKSGIEAPPKRYRYAGKERDGESGLNYHGARYLATWLGRWTAADAAGLKDGLNIYVDSRNNPLRFVDVTGMQSIEQRIEKIESPVGWLFARTGYDLWNVASLGTLSKTEAQDNFGTLEGVADSSFTAVRGVSNAASLGLQDRIYDTQMEEGPGLASIGKGIAKAGEDMLPIAEADILSNPDASTADKWRAGALAVSKIANLVAAGASITGKTMTLPRAKGLGTHPKSLSIERIQQINQKAALKGMLRKTKPPPNIKQRRIYEKAHGKLGNQYQPDHVQEMQLGGPPKDVRNLAPLDAPINQSVGPRIQGQIRTHRMGQRYDRVLIEGQRVPVPDSVGVLISIQAVSTTGNATNDPDAKSPALPVAPGTAALPNTGSATAREELGKEPYTGVDLYVVYPSRPGSH